MTRSKLTFNFSTVSGGVGHGVAVGCEAVAVLRFDGNRPQQRIRHKLVVQYNMRDFVVSAGDVAVHEPVGFI